MTSMTDAGYRVVSRARHVRINCCCAAYSERCDPPQRAIAALLKG
ncbi:hypothetical protein RM530_16685 [Algiphilus sp. W345]|uniref:Uncharacterized protein n=1 Tax=Banduia mediterranea TaxID=3075609 RepID=A0ABU2WM81_9GAMM|nr:hypothetical protein [Algiphilus sp. W345]MDT0498982.1 hypothetical protein [Algiphilus sp. W345]